MNIDILYINLYKYLLKIIVEIFTFKKFILKIIIIIIIYIYIYIYFFFFFFFFDNNLQI